MIFILFLKNLEVLYILGILVILEKKCMYSSSIWKLKKKKCFELATNWCVCVCVFLTQINRPIFFYLAIRVTNAVLGWSKNGPNNGILRKDRKEFDKFRLIFEKKNRMKTSNAVFCLFTRAVSTGEQNSRVEIATQTQGLFVLFRGGARKRRSWVKI